MRIGEIVLLKLSIEQAGEINRRYFRDTGCIDSQRKVNEGDLLPMVVTRAFNLALVNGQVLLDGPSGTMWVQAVHLGDHPGEWHHR